MEDKENMAWPFRPGPENRGELRVSTGLAERRMEALREQQRQERLANPEPFRASRSEVCTDVEMIDCSDLRSTEEEMDCSTDNLPSTNDVNQRVQNLSNFTEKWDHSNFGENLDQHKQYNFYVVDTCVYLDALEGVKELLKYCLVVENHSVLVVPYQVLQEIDSLKIKKPQLCAKLEAASRFILHNLECKNHAFRAQHTLDFKRSKTESHMGDDWIIECALQVQEQVPNVGTVTMVTHDTIMRAKAIAAKLGESTMNRLLTSLSG